MAQTQVEEKILRALRERGELEARELSEASGVAYDTLMSVLVALEEQGFVKARKSEREFVELSEEGKLYARTGTPERRLVEAIGKEKELSVGDAVGKAGLGDEEKNIALQWAVRNGWVKAVKQGAETFLKLLSKQESPAEKALKQLMGKKVEASALDAKAFEVLKARKLVETRKEKTFFVSATKITRRTTITSDTTITQEITQLTPQMLRDDSWKGKKFREYDARTLVAPLASFGKKHAYLELLNEVKRKLVGMGFKEAHGPLVELEFWNMDALFMAQDHPAREIHDVFQIDDPARGEILDKALVEKVRTAHERGLEGSRGWRYKWDPEIAARLVLRSHTTPVSARHLARGLRAPARLFCIGRVFRPDEIDWKHFIEFTQCEGIVVDESMSFRELLGYLKDFAVEIFAAEDARFAPTYFPFTEPSVEMFAKISGKGWAEVGGAGIFRPEMTSALGVREPVLAWGLGVDRLAMLKLGVTDIRDLFSRDEEFLKNKW